MFHENKKLLSKLRFLKSSGAKALAILIDPDKDNTAYFAALKEMQVDYCPDFVFVGGSFVESGATDICIQKLKSFCKAPVLLFPGSYTQLSAYADALLFLSLISGRNPEYLIEQHVQSIPWLKENPIEVIPTSYIIVSDSESSSVLKASNTRPLPTDNIEIILNTAWAGFYQGHQLLYFEAGSGNKNFIPSEIINKVSNEIDLPLICGGGIKNLEAASELCKAGADVVVVGNALEENPYLLKSIFEAVKGISNKATL